jgi:hypothetical protein
MTERFSVSLNCSASNGQALLDSADQFSFLHVRDHHPVLRSCHSHINKRDEVSYCSTGLPIKSVPPELFVGCPKKWAEAPGNVLLQSRLTGLPKDSVANVSQIVTLVKSLLTERVGKLSRAKTDLVLAGIDVVLGR